MRRHQQECTRSAFNRVAIAAGLLLGSAFCAVSQTARPMVVLKTRYEVRMGEATEIPAAADTLDFMVHAKTRRVTAGGQDVAGLVVAPNAAQDRILLAPSSRATPGEYAVTLSATSASGEEMHANVDVVVEPRTTVPNGSTQPPARSRRLRRRRSATWRNIWCPPECRWSICSTTAWKVPTNRLKRWASTWAIS
jgi:hypothetical protein